MKGYSRVKVTVSNGQSWMIGQGSGSKYHLLKTDGVKGQTVCGGQRTMGAGVVYVPLQATFDATAQFVSDNLCKRCYAQIELAIERGYTLKMELLDGGPEQAPEEVPVIEPTKSMGNCLVCGQPVTDPNCGWGQGQPIHMDGRGCFAQVRVARPSEGGPEEATIIPERDLLTQVAEGLNAITDNAGFWTTEQIRDHAQALRLMVEEVQAAPVLVDPDTGDKWNLEALHSMVEGATLVTGTVDVAGIVYRLSTLVFGGSLQFKFWTGPNYGALMVQVADSMPQPVNDAGLYEAFQTKVAAGLAQEGV